MFKRFCWFDTYEDFINNPEQYDDSSLVVIANPPEIHTQGTVIKGVDFDINNYLTKEEAENISVDLSEYATKEEVNNKFNDIDVKPRQYTFDFNSFFKGVFEKIKNGEEYTADIPSNVLSMFGFKNGVLKRGDWFLCKDVYAVVINVYNLSTWDKIFCLAFDDKQIYPSLLYIELEKNSGTVNVGKPSFQSKLIAGDNITIDENNVISATVQEVDLTPYATKEELTSIESNITEINNTLGDVVSSDDFGELQNIVSLKADKSAIPDISNLATVDYVDNKVSDIEIPEVDLTPYATKEEIDSKFEEITNKEPVIHTAKNEDLKELLSKLRSGIPCPKTHLSWDSGLGKGDNINVGDTINASSGNSANVVYIKHDNFSSFAILLPDILYPEAFMKIQFVGTGGIYVEVVSIQRKLTAGDNITIDENNVISATVSEVDLSNYYTKSEVDNLVDNVSVDVDLSEYATKSEVEELETVINGTDKLTIVPYTNAFDTVKTVDYFVYGMKNDLFDIDVDYAVNEVVEFDECEIDEIIFLSDIPYPKIILNGEEVSPKKTTTLYSNSKYNYKIIKCELDNTTTISSFSVSGNHLMKIMVMHDGFAQITPVLLYKKGITSVEDRVYSAEKIINNETKRIDNLTETVSGTSSVIEEVKNDIKTNSDKIKTFETIINGADEFLVYETVDVNSYLQFKDFTVESVESFVNKYKECLGNFFFSTTEDGWTDIPNIVANEIVITTTHPEAGIYLQVVGVDGNVVPNSRETLDTFEFDGDTYYFVKATFDKSYTIFNLCVNDSLFIPHIANGAFPADKIFLFRNHTENIVDKVNNISVDLSDYYTKSEVNNLVDNVSVGEIDLSEYTTKSETKNKINSTISGLTVFESGDYNIFTNGIYDIDEYIDRFTQLASQSYCGYLEDGWTEIPNILADEVIVPARSVNSEIVVLDYSVDGNISPISKETVGEFKIGDGKITYYLVKAKFDKVYNIHNLCINNNSVALVLNGDEVWRNSLFFLFINNDSVESKIDTINNKLINIEDKVFDTWVGTEEQYEALEVKDDNTFYFIKEDEEV